MSFASSIATPMMRAGGAVAGRLGIAAMARTTAVIIGAGVVGALYHVVNDESRNLVQGVRMRGRYRRQRHEGILRAAIGSDLPVALQDRLLLSRDAFKCLMHLLKDPITSSEERAKLRLILGEVFQGSTID